MQKLLTQIKKATYTATLRQSSVTLIGTFLNGIIGVAFYIVVARSLGPYDFGIFSFVTVTIALLSSIANAGTDTGITKFVSKYFLSDKLKALRFLKEGLLLKFIGWGIVILIGFLFSNQIAHLILKKNELLYPFKIAVIGVGGSMLFSFGCAALQSLQKFWQWSFVNVFGNSLRLLLFIFLLFFGIKTAESSILLFIIIPFVAFFVSLLFLPKFLNIAVRKSDFNELFHFNKWVAVTTVIVALSSRLDSLFSARYLNLTEVGYYAVAVSLSGFISQIVLALGTVAAPKFASMDNKKAAKEYFFKFEAFVLILSIIGAPIGIFIAHFFVPLLYGEVFTASIAPLSILIIAYAVFLMTMPINDALLYYFSNSKFFVWLSIAGLLIAVLSGVFLIPQYGMIGAAYSVLIGNIFDLVVPAVYLYFLFK